MLPSYPVITEQLEGIPRLPTRFRKCLLVFLLGIWSPLSSPYPRHAPKPLSSGPCPLWGWKDTNSTGLGSVA